MMDAGQQLSSPVLRAHQIKQQAAGVMGPVIVAAGVQYADNLGTILRIGDAVNCRKVLFVDVPHAESKRVRRVSRAVSDTIEHRFLTYDSFADMKAALPPLIAVELTTTSNDVFHVDLPQDAAFVIGNERHGIPDHILALCQQAVHIPMFGVNSSMNVAVSLGVVLYEWYRQSVAG